jgi:hypothetical protein
MATSADFNLALDTLGSGDTAELQFGTGQIRAWASPWSPPTTGNILPRRSATNRAGGSVKNRCQRLRSCEMMGGEAER